MVTKIDKPIVVQGDQRKEKLGMVHVITGDGKGKTTSALGLAMRAIGTGYKVHMIQFLKSGGTGELYAAKHLPGFSIEQFGVDAIKERQRKQTALGGFDQTKDTTGRFVFQPDEMEKQAARWGFEAAQKIVQSGDYDLVILDEVNCVLDKGLVGMGEMVALLKKNGHTEIMLTGRDAPKALYEHVDYVSEVGRVKHPWQKGICARRGIEY